MQHACYGQRVSEDLTGNTAGALPVEGGEATGIPENIPVHKRDCLLSVGKTWSSVGHYEAASRPQVLVH